MASVLVCQQRHRQSKAASPKGRCSPEAVGPLRAPQMDGNFDEQLRASSAQI